jgi:hypothetical protein
LIDVVKVEFLCAGVEVPFLMDHVSVSEADTLSGLSDITVVDDAIVSVRDGETEYVIADGDLMLGTTTRWYVLDGVETLWAEGDPTPVATVGGTSSPKDGDVGSKADNFLFKLEGGTNISSIDGIDFQETIFPSLVDTIIIFERNGNDVGTMQAIHADGSLGSPVAFVKSGDGGPYASTGIDVNGQTAYGVVFKTSVPVQGVRITASGHDTLSISAPVYVEPPTMIPVPDAGFDDHVLAVGDWVYIGDGPYAETSDYTGPWQSSGGDTYIDNSYWAADIDLPALSGDNKLYGYEEVEGYIYQILDEQFVEGQTYTLQVWVGLAWEGYDDYWSLHFTSEDHSSNLIEVSGNAPIGSWEQVSLEYNATAADAGNRIGIKMQGADFVTFDDVTLYGHPKTRDPRPADGALIMDTWVNLSWTPANFAVTNDVYIGDNFDDVNNGAESTFQGSQTDSSFVIGFPGFPFPDGLVNGVTYYWRIDGINDTNPNSPLKGDVWSFTIVSKTAYNPEPADGVESVGVDDSLSWTPGFGAKLHTIYFGENFDQVDNAAGGLPQGATTYTPGTLKMAKTYYWRVDEFDAVDTFKGDVWSFTTEGAVAALNPANGAVDVTQTPVLTWAPGFGASHDVYFGTDASALELKGSGNLGSESHEPGQLEWNTTYYWRVDETNNASADSPWTGPLWNFTTANFLIIDDMEAYNDLEPAEPESNRIFNAWIDGFGDPTNGSIVGYENPPFAEQAIVNSGSQSMPMSYDNSVGKSEATLTLTSNRDWTVKGVTTLTIWFRGDSDNSAETLYVVLNGSAVVTNDNPDAAKRGTWSQWNID